MITILVFKQADGTWGYAPKAAMQNESIARAFRYSDKPGYPAASYALKAIRRDKTIPKSAAVEIES